MHPKIKKDPYYSQLYPLLGEKGLEEAGFFYDNNPELGLIEKEKQLLCTPMYFPNLETTDSRPPAVLLCTGAFCPIHQGHIDMVLWAKAAVERQGYRVLACYLSPGHDEYINQKTGDKAIGINERIALIQKLIEQQEDKTLMIDPWEGLFCRVAVNFTQVIHRLELYLERHLGQKIPVFYVCGADNARFSLSFLLRGYCVIVGRPLYEEAWQHYRQLSRDNERILWVEGDNVLCSSQLRRYQNYSPPLAKQLLLRVEEQDEREAEVIELLQPYFAEMYLSRLSLQRPLFEHFLSQKQLISLDALLPARYNLAISRHFDLFGLRSLGFGLRPGAAALEEQVEKIPIGQNYCLFDDDRHSGATLHFAKNILGQSGRQVIDSLTLNHSESEEWEILDCRDFLVGGVDSGLVLRLGNRLLRVPYCYPYCCPYIRASIGRPMAFSIAVWQLNKAYFEKKKTLLREVPEGWQQLFGHIGFGEEDSLADICHWHAAQLLRVFE